VNQSIRTDLVGPAAKHREAAAWAGCEAAETASVVRLGKQAFSP
jgi:hypothetical protein